jgi:hypothetical protein
LIYFRITQVIPCDVEIIRANMVFFSKMEREEQTELNDLLGTLDEEVKSSLRSAWRLWGKGFVPYAIEKYTAQTEANAGREKVRSKSLAKAFDRAAEYIHLWCESQDRDKYRRSLKDIAGRLKANVEVMVFSDGRISPLKRMKRGRPLTPLHLINLAWVLYIHLSYFLERKVWEHLQVIWIHHVAPDEEAGGEMRKNLTASPFVELSLMRYADELYFYLLNEKNLSISVVSKDVDVLFQNAYGLSPEEYEKLYVKA